jgi:nucleoside phosphorylase
MRILVVAATDRELATSPEWDVLVCGVGPVDAAARTAAALDRHRPMAVVHVGIAGAHAESDLLPPALVIGAESRYCDLGMGPEWAPSVIVPPAVLLEAARRALPGAAVLAIGTSARVNGTGHVVARPPVEAMEGFGVLRAAQLAGVPAIEVRAISNAIEEPDRSRWRFGEALAAIAAATPRIVREVATCVS